jgi:cytoskeletal protein CcmA (bactofilin family)
VSEAPRVASRIDDDLHSDNDLQHVVAAEGARIPLVPADGVFEGQIEVQGLSLIDGTVRGTVRGTGRVELGPGARIEGLIECEEVASEGTIVGPVVASRRARLGPGAVLEGDLDAPLLEVEETAVWNGAARVGP